MATKGTFEAIDVAVLILYFVGVIGTGFYAMYNTKRSTATGYFLAGRYLTFIPIGASIFASNIGSEHFIGLAGSGAAAGFGVASYELNSCVLIQLLGWVFLPVYIASNIYTMPGYIKKRFGGQRICIYLSSLSLILYVLTKISVNLYSGFIFIRESLEWSLFPSLCLILAITALCTVTGGLAAVIYTDTIQAFLMVGGGLTLMGYAFNEVGGISGLLEKYPKAVVELPLNSTYYKCAQTRPDSFQLLRDPFTGDIPWPGFVFGQTLASIWYWCADQIMVQRALAAKSLSHAQGACLLAGSLKIIPLFMMVMVGMISRILYTEDIACVDKAVCAAVCGNEMGCTNIAYPRIVQGLLPAGLRGLMTAVMLAALVSDLTSIFNSASSLFTLDLYPLIKKHHSTREQMIVGRLFVIVMVIISVVWIPVLEVTEGGQLYHYIQSIAAYLSPPIAVVYLVAVLWPRGNEQGAFWSLMSSFLLGGIWLVLSLTFPAPPCPDEDNRPGFLKLHYMYFALFIGMQAFVVNVTVSLLTAPPPEWRTVRTCYWTRHHTGERADETEKHQAMLLASNGLANMESDESELDMAAPDAVEVVLGDTRMSPGAPYGCVASLRKFGKWFCGLEQATNEEAQLNAKPMTLDQSKNVVYFLNTNLLIICAITIFIFVFMSIPGELERNVL